MFPSKSNNPGPSQASTSSVRRRISSTVVKHPRDYTQEDYGADSQTWMFLKTGEHQLSRASNVIKTLTNEKIVNFFFEQIYSRDDFFTVLNKMKHLLRDLPPLDNPTCAMSIIVGRIGITSIGGLYKENFARLGGINFMRSIHCIINVTWEVPQIATDAWDITKFRIPVADSKHEFIMKYFRETGDIIEDAIKKNKYVIVHCFAGVSRSVTIVIAYLMQHKKMSLEASLNLVRSVRNIAQPSETFMRQLGDFERELRHSN